MTPASDEGTAGVVPHSEGSEGRGGSAGLRPALSAEEWAGAGSGREIALEDPEEVEGGPLVACIDGRFVHVGRYDLEMVLRPHALAALCLHQQSFGFTREMVEAIRECVAVSEREGYFPAHDLAREAADRIAALLPPASPTDAR